MSDDAYAAARRFGVQSPEHAHDVVTACILSWCTYYDPKAFLDSFETWHGILSVEPCKSNSKQRYLYARTQDALWAAFGGTDSMSDVVADIKISRSRSRVPAGQSHKGFAVRAASVATALLLDELLGGGRIVLCGHSLGGAVAVLVAVRLAAELRRLGRLPLLQRVRVITFGQPLVGDADLQRWCVESGVAACVYALVNANDLVPALLLASRHARELVAKDIPERLSAALAGARRSALTRMGRVDLPRWASDFRERLESRDSVDAVVQPIASAHEKFLDPRPIGTTAVAYADGSLRVFAGDEVLRELEHTLRGNVPRRQQIAAHLMQEYWGRVRNLAGHVPPAPAAQCVQHTCFLAPTLGSVSVCMLDSPLPDTPRSVLKVQLVGARLETVTHLTLSGVTTLGHHTRITDVLAAAPNCVVAVLPTPAPRAEYTLRVFTHFGWAQSAPLPRSVIECAQGWAVADSEARRAERVAQARDALLSARDHVTTSLGNLRDSFSSLRK